MKCLHDWRYFIVPDYPNGYEYEPVNILHRQCRLCGKHQDLFDNYGDCKKRWRNVLY